PQQGYPQQPQQGYPQPYQPPPPVYGPAPPPRVDASKNNVGNALLAPGATLLAVGLVSVVFVGGISAIVRDSRLSSAESADSRADTEDHLNGARAADRAMRIGFWSGIGMITVGLPLTIAGSVLKNQARSGVARRIDLRATGVEVKF
ncbi:MAG: hypothetical protein KC468_23990, partial [Myxococcales bacterium]|nr:hypothetical protein [Myxococcales bacterium]